MHCQKCSILGARRSIEPSEFVPGDDGMSSSRQILFFPPIIPTVQELHFIAQKVCVHSARVGGEMPLLLHAVLSCSGGTD